MEKHGRVALQPAYLLHRRPYRETSLLLEAFTPEHGRIGLVARGARRGRSGQQAMLQPFVPLLLSWSGRGELVTLTGAEMVTGGAPRLSGRRLLSAFYLNELLQRLLHRHDPHPALFQDYAVCLQRLAVDSDEAWALRLFEKSLLQELGYGLALTHEAGSGTAVQPQLNYCYHFERGPHPAEGAPQEGVALSGKTLLALAEMLSPDAEAEREAKRLMRSILNQYLGERPLHSRELFARRYPKPRSQ